MLDRLDPRDGPARHADNSPDNRPADLVDLIEVLWHDKWTIAASALCGFALSLTALLFLIKPIYQSEATLLLDHPAGLPDGQVRTIPGLATDIAAINTQLEVLRSHQMMRDLVAQLDLVNDSEFKSKPRGGLLGFGKKTSADTVDRVADEVAGAISVSNIRNSNVLRLTAQSRDAEKSAMLANTLASLYVKGQIAARHSDIDNSVDWLSDRVATLEQEIGQQEAALRDLRASSTLTDVESVAARLAETRSRLMRIRDWQADLHQRSRILARLNSEGADPSLLSQVDDAQLKSLEPGRADAFAKRVVQLQHQTKRDLVQADRQAETLAKVLAQIEAEFDSQAADLARLRRIERDARATELLHDTMLSRLKETALRRGLQMSDSRIMSGAIRGEKVSPRPVKLLMFGTLAGLALGVGLVLLRQSRRAKVPTTNELESGTGYAVLGHIPRAPLRNRKQLVGYLADNPTAPLAEAARNLRTSLLLAATPPQVVLCTSSVPDEGKTTTAIALAHSFARLGQTVLLIEADIRRLSFRDYFSENPYGGLVSALSGAEPLHHLIQQDARTGVDILMGERTAQSAADLFSSPRFRDLLQNLRDTYDHIVIDSPPVLAVPDARVLGQSADSILLTVSIATTTRAQVVQALREFTSVNSQAAGLVVSHMGLRPGTMPGNGQAYGAYTRYYGA